MDTGSSSAIAGMNSLSIGTLKKRILLSVDSLTDVKTFARRPSRSGTRVVNTVGPATWRAVIPRREDMPSV